MAWKNPSQDFLPDAEVLVAQGVYEQAEAAARAHLDTLRTTFGADSLEAANAADALAQALIVSGRGTSDETLTLVRHTLHAKESILGDKHPELVVSLFNLGDVLAERAEF